MYIYNMCINIYIYIFKYMCIIIYIYTDVYTYDVYNTHQYTMYP